MVTLPKPTLLFFDSGVGGLSVYQEVQKLLPDCHYLYCFDNAFFPYSEKPEEGIVERTLKICQCIDNMYPLDLIVIACNTASTVVLPVLRKSISVNCCNIPDCKIAVCTIVPSSTLKDFR